MKHKTLAGFTLIELLVVIGIITFLMTLFFPNFMAARQRARDGQRKNDIAQLQRTLELFKLDQNPQAYPTGTDYLDINLCNKCWSSGGSDCSGNLYMRKMPCDPGSLTPTPYLYLRDTSDTLKYDLSACLENPVDPDRDSDETKNPICTYASYTVHEP